MRPADWRAQVARAVREGSDGPEAWLRPQPALSERSQLAVYQEQYRLRIGDALEEEVPGVMRLLGEHAASLLWRYLDACPPRSYTLDHIADRFVDWLIADGADEPLIDMARLDAAVARAFTAADPVALRPEQVSASTPLALAPHVTLLHLRSNVAWVRAAGEEAPAVERGDRWTVVFRRDLKVRHAEVSEGWWRLLDSLRTDSSLLAALTTVTGDDAPSVGGWLRESVEVGWIGRAPGS